MKPGSFTAERLLALYERVSDADDAVPRLRRFIFDLAVRGKLVEQCSKDEPAAELLTRIRAERGALVKGGAARSHNSVNPIGVAPWKTPSQWVWISLGDTGRIFSGNSVDPATRERLTNTSSGRPFIATKDIGYGFEPINYSNGLLVAPSNEGFKVARANAVLICAEGGSAGRKMAVTDREICFGNKLLANETWGAILPKYVLTVYQSRAFYELFFGQMTGLIGGISIKKFLQLEFPLPPLEEQQRIVSKVDELMALCDQLEAARIEREAVRDRLTAATMARLTTPEADGEAFADHARFALESLPSLTTRPDQIKTLRQTILNLAVRGKLVEQDPTDEPAAELLKRIAAERDELIKSKRIRREDKVLPPEAGKEPHSIPESWAWTKVATAFLFTEYGTSSKSEPAQNGVPVLTMGNIQDGKVIWGNEKRIPTSSAELPGLYLKKLDLLYNRTNSAELVGKTGVYLGEDDIFTFASYLIRLRPSHEHTNPKYLNISMNAPMFRETQILPLIKQQTGQANVNGTALKNMIIPLPPIAEQYRIVAKVHDLMAVCDQLEASLTASSASRTRLLDALLHEALAQNSEPDVAA